MNYQYQFYTDEQFIQLYGKNWEDFIPFGWNDSMNKFKGKPLIKETVEKFPTVYKEYTISKEMVFDTTDDKAFEKALELEARKKLFLSKISINRSDRHLFITYDIGYLVKFSIYKSPTENCQVASIAAFQNLLNFCKDEDILSILNVVVSKSHLSKTLFIIDVSENFSNRLQSNMEIFQKYTSTNGSKMCLGLLKI